jgi:hypothetical protein
LAEAEDLPFRFLEQPNPFQEVIMTTARWYVAFLVAGALIVGCDDKKPDQPKVNPTPPAPTATTPKVDVPKVDTTKVGDAAKTATDTAKTATDTAKTEIGKVADPSKLTIDPTKVTTPTTPTTPDVNKTTETVKTTTTDAAANTQAADWMTKLGDAIKANKLDEAKTYLDKLDGIKGSLSPEWKSKLDALKTSYEAAKLKGGVPNLTK